MKQTTLAVAAATLLSLSNGAIAANEEPAEAGNTAQQEAETALLPAPFRALLNNGSKFNGEWFRGGRFGKLTLRIEKSAMADGDIAFYGSLYDSDLPQASISLAGTCNAAPNEDGTYTMLITLYDGAYDPDTPTAEIYDHPNSVLELSLSKDGRLSGIMTREDWQDTPQKAFRVNFKHTTTKDAVTQTEWSRAHIALFAPQSVFLGSWSRDTLSGGMALKVIKSEVVADAIHFHGTLYNPQLPAAHFYVNGRCGLTKQEENGGGIVDITLLDGSFDPNEATADAFENEDARLELMSDANGNLTGVLTRDDWKDAPYLDFTVHLKAKNED